MTQPREENARLTPADGRARLLELVRTEEIDTLTDTLGDNREARQLLWELRLGRFLRDVKKHSGRWGRWMSHDFSHYYIKKFVALATSVADEPHVEDALSRLAVPNGPAPEPRWQSYGALDIALRHLAGQRSRGEEITALDEYQHQHRFPWAEKHRHCVWALCSFVDVQPLIGALTEKAPTRYVWFGHIDRRERTLHFHPGWLAFCLRFEQPVTPSPQIAFVVPFLASTRPG